MNEPNEAYHGGWGSGSGVDAGYPCFEPVMPKHPQTGLVVSMTLLARAMNVALLYVIIFNTMKNTEHELS